jgi:hypothetical protein
MFEVVMAHEEGLILDAVHVYNVRNVVDREIDSTAEIIWSEDGLKARLRGPPGMMT